MSPVHRTRRTLSAARRTAEAPDDVDAAERAALRILGGAAQSAHDLHRRLVRRGFSEVTAAAAVDRCRELGYVDDSALAASVAARHSRHAHGAARVVADLRRRGVSPDVIQTATSQLAEGEESAALSAASALLEREQRRGELDDAAWRRMGAALQRRGFSAGAVRKSLRSLDTGHTAGAGR